MDEYAPAVAWTGADQDDIDLGAAMRAASSSSGPSFSLGGVLSSVNSITGTAAGVVRSLYQARTDISRIQASSAIDQVRLGAQLDAERIRAAQLARQAQTMPITIGGLNLQPYMPIIVLGVAALAWRRFAR
jgi:hypothetical protein